MKPTRFTADDADRAHHEWGANCGPGAIAGILGMTLDEVRPHMGDFESKRYTNPTLMWEVLGRLGVDFKARRVREWPTFGLARIQWEGPWTRPGVPPRAAYRYTHWIGVKRAAADIGIFDINAIGNGSGWCSLADWSGILVPMILSEAVPKASGAWHIAHSVEVKP